MTSIFRIITYGVVFTAFLGLLFGTSHFYTGIVGYEGLPFMEPKAGAYNLRYIPAAFFSALTPFFHRFALLNSVSLVVTVEITLRGITFFKRMLAPTPQIIIED